MPRHIIQTIYDASQTQRAIVFRRDDGSFSFEGQRFAEVEDCWIPHGIYSESFCDTLEAAEREARNRIPWLRTALPSPPPMGAPRPPRRQIAIREISLDPATGLRNVPELPSSEDYDAIYRSAMSVRWDEDSRTLYMFPWAERTPLAAFQRIVNEVAEEYGDQLVLTADTIWRDISPEDQAAIRAWSESAAQL